jgi:regulator of sirC expression with transglutaminase-like and TPR domain
MNFDSRITWEKLALEIDLLAAEEPNSLVPLLIGLNAMLWPNEPQEWSFRTLNFMTYELMSLAESYPESDRVHILNDYFFDQKGFQIVSGADEPNEMHLLMKPVLTKRLGAPIPVTLLYLHLATNLDLPIYPIKLNNMSVLKWIRSGKSHYLDLCCAGRIMEQSQLIRLLNKDVRNSTDCDETSSLDILPSKLVFSQYVRQLLKLFEKGENPTQMLLLYDVLLQLEPVQLTTLADRALLRQRLGYAQEAILDLKRYFSYVDREQAPADLQMAFRQLEALGDLNQVGRNEVFH